MDSQNEIKQETFNKKEMKSERIKRRYVRTFYFSFCIAFIVFGIIAILFFVYSQDKNAFGSTTRYYEKALSYYENNDYDNAEKALYDCIEFDPSYTQARSLLIDILIKDKKYEEALVMTKESISLHPRNENYYIQNIQALTGQNRITEAIDFIGSISANYILVKLSDRRPANFVSSPDPGTYEESINVRFENLKNAEIYYTTDGTAPDLNSTKYDGTPIHIDSDTMTIRAFAINEEGLVSDEYVATYRIYKSNSPYVFIDVAMEPIVRASIGKQTGSILYGDMEKIVSLSNSIIPVTERGFLTSLDDLLAMENLVEIDLRDETAIGSFDKLSSLKNITKITFSNCGVTDDKLSIFASLVNLEKLDLSNNKLTDISSLSSLTRLKELYLSNNLLKNINIFESALTGLTDIDLSGNNLSNISSMQKLVNLKTIKLSENLITDISVMSSMPQLKEIDISYNAVVNLDGISRLANVTTLNLSNTQVNSLSKISEYKKLQNLDISGTKMTSLDSVAPLKSVTSLIMSSTSMKDFEKIAFNSIRQLDVSSCNLSDLTAIALVDSVQNLNLSKNDVTDLTPLAKMRNLQSLNVQDNTNLLLISVMESCVTLRTINCINTGVTLTEANVLERNGVSVIR